MDLAEGHLAALAYLNANPEIRVFNLGTGYGVSVLELVNAYEKAVNIKIPFSVVDRRKGDVASCYADNNLAKCHLMWSPKRSISDMCISSWLAQSKNKDF